jgi:2,3-bisphosphoglycerate-independent phosphoglycerate mutase
LVDVVNSIRLSIDKENDTIITAKHATEHRIGLKVTNDYVCDQITGTDPLKDNLKLRRAKAKIPEAEKTAEIVN